MERWQWNGKTVEVVTKFVFLGVLITKDGLCDKEICRRIAMGKAAMGGLTTVWKDRGIMLQTKVKLVKALVFPIVLYGAETWTMRKTERKKIDAFELWCWRRVMRVSWMERKTNVWVLENVKPKWTLESRVIKAALSYFGHVVRKERGMENDVMLGGMRGKRRRGRPRTKWLDTIKDVKGPSINIMRLDRIHGKSKENKRESRPISECQRASGMERSYRGCRQGSDTTRRHKVTR